MRGLYAVKKDGVNASIISAGEAAGLCIVQLVHPGVTQGRTIIVAGQPLQVSGSGHRKNGFGAPVGNAPGKVGIAGNAGIIDGYGNGGKPAVSGGKLIGKQLRAFSIRFADSDALLVEGSELIGVFLPTTGLCAVCRGLFDPSFFFDRGLSSSFFDSLEELFGLWLSLDFSSLVDFRFGVSGKPIVSHVFASIAKGDFPASTLKQRFDQFL